MIEPHILKHLEDIVNSVDLSVIPYQKGNSIRIKHIIIRKSSHGYLLYDCKENKKLKSFYSKTGAVAYAHSIIYKTKSGPDIENLDHNVAKHHLDSLFYKNTIEKSKDELKKEVAETRLEIALEKTHQARHQLMNYLII